MEQIGRQGVGDKHVRHRWSVLVLSALTAVWVVACGGGAVEADGSAAAQTRDQQTVDETELLAQSAELNAQELQHKALRMPSGGSQTKLLPLIPSPVFRFHDISSGAHFYTASEIERDRMLAGGAYANYQFEGTAFYASFPSNISPILQSVNRFYNQRTGVHFYTISDTERDFILNNPALSHYQFEGIPFLASVVDGPAFVPLHRFYVPQTGYHFYTVSQDEVDTIINTLSGVYTYEGIAFYVLKPVQVT